MTEFFSDSRGGFSLYVSSTGDGSIPHVRFCLAHHGEDPDRVIEVFFQEHKQADFLLVPLFAHGMAPRIELSTPRSLLAGLATVHLEPNGAIAKQWRVACEYHGVNWPKRLQAKPVSKAQAEVDATASG
jgi:hypothetical protein